MAHLAGLIGIVIKEFEPLVAPLALAHGTPVGKHCSIMSRFASSHSPPPPFGNVIKNVFLAKLCKKYFVQGFFSGEETSSVQDFESLIFLILYFAKLTSSFASSFSKR